MWLCVVLFVAGAAQRHLEVLRMVHAVLDPSTSAAVAEPPATPVVAALADGKSTEIKKAVDTEKADDGKKGDEAKMIENTTAAAAGAASSVAKRKR